MADTYNNKIKSIAFGTMETRTMFGKGNPGILHEPGGNAAWDGRVRVADTNNHRLLRGMLTTGELEEMPLRG